MTQKPSDLISIANPKLSEKLEKKAHKEELVAEREQESAQTEAHQNFKKDVWKAVFTLNLLRYGLALFLLILISLRQIGIEVGLSDNLMHPTWFVLSTIAILISAVTFSFFAHSKKAKSDR